MSDRARPGAIGVVGLGYVGLPLALAFARAGHRVVGFDSDGMRIEELRRGLDRTRETEPGDLPHENLICTDDARLLERPDFYVVTAPTPIDSARRPDLSAVLSASRSVGRSLKRGDVVVYESTMYPGATEEDCAVVLEAESGLKCGVDFWLGYSPERVNPGDRAHRLETVPKVVAAQTPEVLDVVASVYSSVVAAGIHRAPNIKTAEAAKVIENAQRDLNIAFVNELSLIFNRLGIDTRDVLAAAATKWNFHPYVPGLVGGHCIGVDPYYLTHKAEQVGYHPQVILAGRRVNDQMGAYVAHQCVRMLSRRRTPGNSLATVLGLAFKENVPDIRSTQVVQLIGELAAFGVRIQVHDPFADPVEAQRLYGIALSTLEDLEPADAVVLAVAHDGFVREGWTLVERLLGESGGVVLDLKGVLGRDTCPESVELWRL